MAALSWLQRFKTLRITETHYTITAQDVATAHVCCSWFTPFTVPFVCTVFCVNSLFDPVRYIVTFVCIFLLRKTVPSCCHCNYCNFVIYVELQCIFFAECFCAYFLFVICCLVFHPQGCNKLDLIAVRYHKTWEPCLAYIHAGSRTKAKSQSNLFHENDILLSCWYNTGLCSLI